MIFKARLLMRAARFGELNGFVLMSFLTVVVIATFGSSLSMDVPELVKVQPSFDKAYLGQVLGVVVQVVCIVITAFISLQTYRMLQKIVARCELAEDELAWIKDHHEYERMVEDSELMRLAANVQRVCRTYPATHGLFARFLGDYRTLVEEYGPQQADKTIQEARIELLNNQAEEGLEQHAARVRREGMRKEREGR